MPETRVVNLYKEPYDVYVGRGRGSIWGNPFSHKEGTLAEFKVETREEAIQAFAKWILTQQHMLNQIHTLKGKTLGCFCRPQACHAYVLAELAEASLP